MFCLRRCFVRQTNLCSTFLQVFILKKSYKGDIFVPEVRRTHLHTGNKQGKEYARFFKSAEGSVGYIESLTQPFSAILRGKWVLFLISCESVVNTAIRKKKPGFILLNKVFQHFGMMRNN